MPERRRDGRAPHPAGEAAAIAPSPAPRPGGPGGSGGTGVHRVSRAPPPPPAGVTEGGMLGGINETDLALLLARSSCLPSPSQPAKKCSGRPHTINPSPAAPPAILGRANSPSGFRPCHIPRGDSRAPGSPGHPINPMSPVSWLVASLRPPAGLGREAVTPRKIRQCRACHQRRRLLSACGGLQCIATVPWWRGAVVAW